MSETDEFESEESDYMDDDIGTKGREPVDRLSELPQSLIFHILSFLSMRDVIKTSLLSKSWKNLWTTVPCLRFIDLLVDDDDDDYGNPRIDGLRNFVNRSLIFWRGNRILKFEISIDSDFHYSFAFASDVDLWVRFAVENKAEELSLCFNYENNDYENKYRLPRRLYSCSSLTKLSLLGCNLRTKTSPVWNQLNTLRIDSYDISDCTMNQVLLGSPQLEVLDLSVVWIKENLNIRSTSLKKMKVKFEDIYDKKQPGMLSIQCPNVETFEIFGALYPKCLSLQVSSLTDAAFWFYQSEVHECGWKEMLGETLNHIFSTIQLVERLTLSSLSVQVLGEFQKQHLFSPLSNVTFLKLQIGGCIEPGDMMNLLLVFPSLRILVIEDHKDSLFHNRKKYLKFEANLYNSFLLQQKTIEIISDFKDSSIFRFIEFLLKHDSVLEKLVIRIKRMNILDLQRHLCIIMETLLRMPRSSPNAEVILKNANHHC